MQSFYEFMKTEERRHGKRLKTSEIFVLEVEWEKMQNARPIDERRAEIVEKIAELKAKLGYDKEPDLSEYFHLGQVGGSGWTKSRRRQQARSLDATINRAKKNLPLCTSLMNLENRLAEIDKQSAE